MPARILVLDDEPAIRALVEFPEDVRTLYKPFSIDTLQDAVRKLLAG
jgi:hypothetical protein